VIYVSNATSVEIFQGAAIFPAESGRMHSFYARSSFGSVEIKPPNRADNGRIDVGISG
jgi:hypothetical protein